jgi:hypothetical protein
MNVFDCLPLTTHRTYFSLLQSVYNTGIVKQVSTLCWHHLLLRCWVMEFQPLKTQWTWKRIWKFLRAGFFLEGFLLSTVLHLKHKYRFRLSCTMTSCRVAAVYQGYRKIYSLHYFDTSSVHLLFCSWCRFVTVGPLLYYYRPARQ